MRRLFLLGIPALVCGGFQTADAGQNITQLVQAMPCQVVHDVLDKASHVWSYKDFPQATSPFVPAEAWTPALLGTFRQRAMQCEVDDPQTTHFDTGVIGVIVSNMSKGLDQRSQAAAKEQAQREYQAQIQERQRNTALDQVKMDLSTADQMATASDLQQQLEKIGKDLHSPGVTDSDRDDYEGPVEELENKLTGIINKDKADFDAQAKSRETQEDAQEQEIQRLQKLNEAKRAQISAERDRQARLDAAKREALELDNAQKQAEQPAPPPAQKQGTGEMDDCPSMVAHMNIDYARLIAHLQSDMARYKSFSSTELMMDPAPTCALLIDQVEMASRLLEWTRECPENGKINTEANRDKLAATALGFRQQASSLQCR